MNNVIQFPGPRTQHQSQPLPLHVSHLDGVVRGTPGQSMEDFGDRMERIKSSMEKINNLMAELKKSRKSSHEY